MVVTRRNNKIPSAKGKENNTAAAKKPAATKKALPPKKKAPPAKKKKAPAAAPPVHAAVTPKVIIRPAIVDPIAVALSNYSAKAEGGHWDVATKQGKMSYWCQHASRDDEDCVR